MTGDIMDVFSIGGASKPVQTWGPTASVDVYIPALGPNVGTDWLVEGMQVNAKEIVDIRQCFNDVSYIYALGNDQGQCSISVMFMIFIGTKECQGDNNLNTISDGLDYYKINRISENTSPMDIGIGSFATTGWLEGISVGQVDAERGICHGVANFIMQLG